MFPVNRFTNLVSKWLGKLDYKVSGKLLRRKTPMENIGEDEFV